MYLDELLDHRPLLVHDPVDAEIEVGAIELKKLPQEVLELHPCVTHDRSPPFTPD
jgi:hypothetical protein